MNKSNPCQGSMPLNLVIEEFQLIYLHLEMWGKVEDCNKNKKEDKLSLKSQKLQESNQRKNRKNKMNKIERWYKD